MSFIVICTWRSSLNFVKSIFSRSGSGNLLSSNQLIDAAQFEAPSSGHTKTAQCWRMLTNCKCNSLSMSFIVICTWRSSLIFVKSNFSRRGSCNCHLINSLTLHSLRIHPRDRPRLRSSCWRMLTICQCKFSLINVLYCDLHLEIFTDLCEM